MSKDEVSKVLAEAIKLLREAKGAIDDHKLSTFSVPVVVSSPSGTVRVSSDGKVSVEPNKKLLEKAATDQIHENRRDSYISGFSGSSTCPRCGGSGVI